MKKKTVGDTFYEAVIKYLQDHKDEFTADKEHHLTVSSENNKIVCRAIHCGFTAINNIAGMMAIPIMCDM